MVPPGKPLLAFLLLAALALAGCSAGGGGASGDDLGDGAPEIEATDTTGGIRGVVVDDAIRPIEGVKLFITGAEEAKEATSDANGLFAVSGLKEGTYLLRASHPLYSEATATADVKAGVKDPQAVKLQLARTVFDEPYMNTLNFDGFIVCSTNIPFFLSEECGEGVGSPEQFCDLDDTLPCIDNPVFPGERIGGQAGNNVQYDFYIDAPTIKSMIVEIHWKATSDTAKGLYTPVALDWFCDPICGGNRLLELEGPSPLYAELTGEDLAALNLTPDMRISAFTWASPEGTTAGTGVTLNQGYKLFVSNFYVLPAPTGWSFIAGDKDPYNGS